MSEAIAATSSAPASTSYHPSETSASTSTFIESSSSLRDTRSDDEADQDDDDEEKLFAELDRELDMMEDEANFGHKDVDTVAGFDMAEFRERRMAELRQE